MISNFYTDNEIKLSEKLGKAFGKLREYVAGRYRPGKKTIRSPEQRNLTRHIY
jgi:hypothetical protein